MIRVEVVLRDVSDIDEVFTNWDKYGCGEALSSEMPQFEVSNFQKQTGVSAAQSAVNPNYTWNIVFSTSANVPAMNFYDAQNGTLLGNIEGTPVAKDEVYTLLNKIIIQKSTGVTTTPTTATTTTQTEKVIGWSLAGLLIFFLLKVKK